MTRTRLPDRRPARTIEVVWGQHRFHVTVGFCPRTAQVREVFYGDGLKTGTDLLHTVQDGCVLVSLLLQFGMAPAGIARSLSAEGIVGAVMAAVIADRGAP